jgi:putative Mg2+ transporter-C (MgtC) family protein
MTIIEGFGLNSDLLFRILLAVALGGLIGFERQIQHRPAGLRTHMLVCIGAAIFTIISLSFTSDSARIAAGIVTGIGFLGAGSIIALRGHIQGITTAATLWVAASIGLTVGVGQYTLAIIAAIVVFAILQIKRVEERFSPRKESALD